MFVGDWNVAAEIWQRYNHLSIWRVRDGGLQMFLALSSAVLAFAAGQWVSMLVRSGLLAGFFTLLAAMVMTLWSVACLVMQLGWLWFVLPIPLLLFFATWLRAPDWINENATLKARGWAAATVAIPTVLLCAAAPIVRVNQIPVSPKGPGFSVDGYLEQITPELLAAGQSYREANAAVLADHKGKPALELLLAAANGPPAVLEDPANLTDWPVVYDDLLVSILLDSGESLEQAGRLDEAMERYFAIFKVQSDLANFSPYLLSLNESLFRESGKLRVFQRLNEWSARELQTQERLQLAIKRLEAVSVDVLHAEDAVKSNFILCQRYIEGDDRLASALLGTDNRFIFQRQLVARFAPWEARRELRSLSLRTRYWLERISSLASRLQQGLDREVPYNTALHDLANVNGYATGPHELTEPFDRWANRRHQRLADFETMRRSSLVVLACQAYRQQHGELPPKLQGLVDAGYFTKLPTDPFTGRPFVYLRGGLPTPPASEDQYDFDQWARGSDKINGIIEFERPCLWSPGSHVLTQADDSHSDNPHGFLFGQSTGVTGVMRSPNYEAWARGEWFPIPFAKSTEKAEAKPKAESKPEQTPSTLPPRPATDVDDLFRDISAESDGKQP
jgi:hypothetical protein